MQPPTEVLMLGFGKIAAGALIPNCTVPVHVFARPSHILDQLWHDEGYYVHFGETTEWVAVASVNELYTGAGSEAFCTRLLEGNPLVLTAVRDGQPEVANWLDRQFTDDWPLRPLAIVPCEGRVHPAVLSLQAAHGYRVLQTVVDRICTQRPMVTETGIEITVERYLEWVLEGDAAIASVLGARPVNDIGSYAECKRTMLNTLHCMIALYAYAAGENRLLAYLEDDVHYALLTDLGAELYTCLSEEAKLWAKPEQSIRRIAETEDTVERIIAQLFAPQHPGDLEAALRTKVFDPTDGATGPAVTGAKKIALAVMHGWRVW